MQTDPRTAPSRRSVLLGAAAAIAAAALPAPVRAVPERTHYTAIVVGTGVGGSVAAARLGAAGVDTLVLERGRSYRHDDHAEVYAPGTNPLHPNALWAPALGRTGVFDVELAGTMAILRGAAVGGGSVPYFGATIPPHARYYDKIFRAGPRYQQLMAEYVPRALRNLRAETIPDDIRASRPFAMMRRFEDSMARAGWPSRSVPSTINWDVVRRELRGEVRRSVTVGEMMFGVSNGGKRELSTTYLGSALRRPSVQMRTLQRVTGLTQERGRVAVHAEELDVQGAVVRRRDYTCDQLFLAGGAYGTPELLLASRLAGGLPNLNEHVGTQVGDNGDQFAARLVPGPFEPRPGCIVTSAFVDDDPNYLPTVVQTAGSVARLPYIVYFTIPVDWENRTSWEIVAGTPKLVVPPLSLVADAGAANARVLRRVTDVEGGIALAPLPGIPIAGPDPGIGISPAGLPPSGTAHLLGGAVLGAASDADGRLHGHPAIRVVDGAGIPGNAGGANPSLVITAFAEYLMDRALGA
ncbi:GMC family oxidoreductase N-terminal domain-containing protein [Tsukamurella paurometabola]|uniref:GMC family oxidoreductase N-terminal domain-containing protein n=1 Tax=Tsukamurella paurometabola TaxID=2061 RepID=UPI0013DEA4C2|nr:GMC family oxidoreductase N-terminal domain-containing protein [Tsukamurella paurometabola]UEA82504.1 GMC family oxidoreductase N-terminal domain-containing protein [Tsukamurella paurometabola]